MLLAHLVHRNHRGQASVWVVLQAHPRHGNKIQSLHPPSNTGWLHHPLQRAWGAPAHTLHPGCEVPAAQAGQQGAGLSGAGEHGHSPWPRTPGLSLPRSRPTPSLAARGTPTPPAQGTTPPSPHPGAAGKSRPHPGRRHRKEHMHRDPAPHGLPFIRGLWQQPGYKQSSSSLGRPALQRSPLAFSGGVSTASS